MPRFWTLLSLWLASVIVATGIGVERARAGHSSEALLPDTTQGFVAISNVDYLNDQWNKTQLGHLMADPAMKPFAKDIRRQFEQRWASIYDRLGLTLEDMREVPGGDTAIALIAPEPGKAALAIVIDVTGKLSQASAVLEKVTATQLQRGAKRNSLKIEGCPDAVIQFDLPELEDEKEAGRSALPGAKDADVEKSAKKAASEDPGATVNRQAFYCLTNNLLIVSDNLEVTKGILGRALGGKAGSLAEYKPFQTVMERCRADYGKNVPQIRWFIHPLGYAEAARAATPEGQRRKGKSILEVMRNQGVGGIKGVGGFADFSAENFDLIHRTAIYAPPPYEKSMKMLVLLNQTDFLPESWVPRDIATYTTFYFDIQNAFDHFGSLFDELFGQGEEGVWEETKMSLKQDPNGPQIDLREDLIRHLGHRVSMATDYQLPITTSSERLLFAIEVKNAKAVAKAVEKLLKGDKTVKRREVKGNVIWEIVGDETPEPMAPEITFGGAPAVTPAHPPRRKLLGDDEEDEEERKPLLPHAAVTVWQDRLLIASHIDFLLKVIAPADAPSPLRDEFDYRTVSEEIGKLDPREKCFRFFSRTDEEYRPTYELVRQNKMPESESMFARLLNALFGEGKKGATRAQRIDGSQLPEYEAVRQYLDPAALQITSEPEGWFLKGFTLGQQLERTPSDKEKAAKPSEPVKSKNATRPAEAAQQPEKAAPADDEASTAPEKTETNAPPSTDHKEPQEASPADDE